MCLGFFFGHAYEVQMRGRLGSVPTDERGTITWTGKDTFALPNLLEDIAYVAGIDGAGPYLDLSECLWVVAATHLL